MKKISVILILLTLLSVSLTCEDLKLTEKEAMDLIRKHEKFPSIFSLFIKFKPEINTGICSEFIRLVDEGYLAVAEYEMGCLRRGQLKHQKRGRFPLLYSIPKITEKGRNLIHHVKFENGSNEVHLYLNIIMWDVEKINEILIDHDNKIARVTYTVSIKTTDYLEKLWNIDKDLMLENLRNANLKRSKRSINLKKWDKGWRVSGW